MLFNNLPTNKQTMSDEQAWKKQAIEKSRVELLRRISIQRKAVFGVPARPYFTMPLTKEKFR